jgi:hypothetical protein
MDLGIASGSPTASKRQAQLPNFLSLSIWRAAVNAYPSHARKKFAAWAALRLDWRFYGRADVFPSLANPRR